MDKIPKCPHCGSTDTEVVYFCIGLGEIIRLCKNCHKEFDNSPKNKTRMDNHSFGWFQESFAMMRDAITIFGYLADKKLKGIPISKEEQATIRDYREYMKTFITKIWIKN